MEPWRRVFREGIAPQLPLPALEALRLGLLKNDPRLRPGSTVEESWTINGTGIIQGCAIGYGGRKGAQLRTAREVQQFFADVCFAANEALGDPGASKYFTDWFDHNRREVAFPALLTEVNRAIACRVTRDTDEELIDDLDDAEEALPP